MLSNVYMKNSRFPPWITKTIQYARMLWNMNRKTFRDRHECCRQTALHARMLDSAWDTTCTSRQFCETRSTDHRYGNASSSNYDCSYTFDCVRRGVCSALLLLKSVHGFYRLIGQHNVATLLQLIRATHKDQTWFAQFPSCCAANMELSYRYISVRQPSAEISSGLDSNLTCSSAPITWLYLRELLRSKL